METRGIQPGRGGRIVGQHGSPADEGDGVVRHAQTLLVTGQRARAAEGGYGRAMRAAVYTRYGGPDVVRVLDVEPPKPGPTDLLVKVQRPP